MKKSVCLMLAVLLLFFSCNEENKESISDSETPKQVLDPENDMFQLASGNTEDFFENSSMSEEIFNKAFSLRYGNLEEEPIQDYDKIKLDSVKTSKGTEIISPLRELNQYKIKYNEKTLYNSYAIEKTNEKIDIRGDLFVSMCTPSELVSSGYETDRYFYDNDNPKSERTVTVFFSNPIIPLQKLGEIQTSSDVISINPPVKGTYHWKSTSIIEFEPSENYLPNQTYTINVNKNLKDIASNKIIEDEENFTSFTFRTPELKIVSGFYSLDDPEELKNISVRFNYPVKAERIKPFLKFYVDGKELNYTVCQYSDDKNVYNNEIVCSITDNVVEDKKIHVKFLSGAQIENGKIAKTNDTDFVFDSYPGFIHKNTYEYGSYASLYFSCALKPESVVNAIKITPAIENFSKDNIDVHGSSISITGLEYKTNYKIELAGSIQDKYNRLLKNPHTVSITTGEAPSKFKLSIKDGKDLLEAGYDPKMYIEYLNIDENSFYQVEAAKNPFSNSKFITASKELTPGKSKKMFEFIDLKPFLNDSGKGFIRFNESFNTHHDSYDFETDSYHKKSTNVIGEYDLQVTDLGVTVRYGFNKFVVLVTSIKTGEPIANAAVKILCSDIASYENIDDIHTDIMGKTDEKGFAVINLGPSIFCKNFWKGFYVYVSAADDKVIFKPNSHNSYRFNVYPSMPFSAENVSQMTYMFCDRKLYKPGEKVSFRGIDRDLCLGIYSIYNGEASLWIEGESYKSKVQDVALTPSGGFAGYFTLPDDIGYGSYTLYYQRKGSGGIAYIPLMVETFEPLKYESSISDDGKIIYSGDKINATLKANYLAGGSLSGAKYNASWSRETDYFRSSEKSLKGYAFGPMGAYESETFIGNDKGFLDDGSATLQTLTGKETNECVPYKYSVSANVTDLSNQVISASKSFTVHPSLYYIGISRPVGIKGYPKKGTAINFEYVLSDADGSITKKLNSVCASNTGLKIELIREDWQVVKQKGISGNIYDSYERVEVVEQSISQNIKLKDTFSLTPSKAGYYIIRLTSKDSKNRKVMSEQSIYVTGSDYAYSRGSSSNELRLTPDQDMYDVGDTAKILMQSPLPKGKYLITVEREGIFTEEVRDIDGSFSEIEIPIAENYLPVVYVSVSSYSIRTKAPSVEYGERDMDKPKEYYGVTALNVNPRAKAFSVEVKKEKDFYKPGEEVTVTLTAKKGNKPLKNAELTFMAVDRAVLDLIDYHVPDPISFFYNKSKFNTYVAGGDTRSLLNDPVTYTLKDLMGGDSDSKDGETVREDFTATAVFEPVVITDEKGNAKVKFKMPDNLTTYRITVFGAWNDCYALKESEIGVKNIINVTKSVPKSLRERDTAEAGVLLTNLDTKAHTVTVSLEIEEKDKVNKGTGYTIPKGSAFIDGKTSYKINMKSGDISTVYFDVAAVEKGNVNLCFHVKSDVLNEKIVCPIEIEKSYMMETVTATGTLTPDEKSAMELVVIPADAEDNEGKLSVMLDATRLSLLKDSIDYLFHYPYGCNEQRASAMLPLVVFGNYIDDFELKSEVNDVKATIENEFLKWKKCQHDDGGFGYWPEDIYSNAYVSRRIAQICAYARAKGYETYIDFQKLLHYLAKETSHGNSFNYYANSTYYYYLVSLFGGVLEKVHFDDMMDNIEKAKENNDVSTLAYLGMTFSNCKKNDEAKLCLKEIRKKLTPSAQGVYLADADYYPYYFENNEVSKLSLILQFFAKVQPYDGLNAKILYTILHSPMLKKGYWGNTSTTASVLLAVDSLIKYETPEVDLKAEASFANNSIVKGEFKGITAKPAIGVASFANQGMSKIQKNTELPLDITKKGKGPLYYTVSMKYALPSELVTAREEGLSIDQIITDDETGLIVSPSDLIAGKIYKMEVSVKASHDYNYVALRIPVPSGSDIQNSKFVTSVDSDDAYNEDYGYYYRYDSYNSKTVKNNEVQYFWDNFNKGKDSVSFKFQANRRGVYPVPATLAECMYEEEIFGRTTGILYCIK